MKTFRFEGYSDDTFGEYGITNDDHDNCANGSGMVFRVRSGAYSLLVVGHYAPAPCNGWMIGVAADDTDGSADDRSIPPWKITMEASAETPYSPALLVEAPEDAIVEYVGALGEE